MTRLRDADLGAAAAFLANANASAVSTEQLVEQIVGALPNLLRSDSAIYARFETDSCRTLTVATDPRLAELRERDPDAWWHYLGQHPIVAYRSATHDGRAVRFSDFVSRREFRRREIYHLFFGPCEAEYVMGVEFCRSPREFIHIGSTRRGGDFGERERVLLDLLRPHLARFFRRVGLDDGALAPLRALGLSRREAEVLTLIVRGQSTSAVAQTLWLQPTTVRKHLERVYRTLGVRTRIDAMAVVLTAWGETPPASADQDMLARRMRETASLAAGLTDREVRVVELAAQGLTNSEIANRLAIAPATVKKHLEHVYEKLDAQSRTQAAARILGLREWRQGGREPACPRVIIPK